MYTCPLISFLLSLQQGNPSNVHLVSSSSFNISHLSPVKIYHYLYYLRVPKRVFSFSFFNISLKSFTKIDYLFDRVSFTHTGNFVNFENSGKDRSMYTKLHGGKRNEERFTSRSSNWRTRAHSIVKTGPFQPLSSFLARSPGCRPVFPSLSLAIFPLRTVHLLDAHSTLSSRRRVVSRYPFAAHSTFSSSLKSSLPLPLRRSSRRNPILFGPSSILSTSFDFYDGTFANRVRLSLRRTRNGNSFLSV